MNKVVKRNGFPQTAKQVKFCHEYIKDFVSKAAALRAGYSPRAADNETPKMLRRFAPYILKLQEQKTIAVVAKTSLDQEDLLTSLARVATCDPRDFVTTETTTVTKDGKKMIVRRERLKRLHELTPEQADVVGEIVEVDGRVIYTLRDKDAAQIQYGRHLGMYDPKLIHEHRHAHLHAGINLAEVPGDKLAELEDEFVKLLGPSAARILGYNTPQAALEYIQEDSDVDHSGTRRPSKDRGILRKAPVEKIGPRKGNHGK